MEDSGIIKLITRIGFWGLLIAVPLFVSAYDDRTTHPALTQEIVKYFNLKFTELTISDTDAEYIIKGSENEDAFGRWMRHYYDPVHNRGLSYLGTQWQSSKEWAKDTIAQATHKLKDLPNKTLYGSLKDKFSGETDFSWDRAVYEYAWGDKQRALTALGHVLHLIEDASVPDHTRNDPHPALGNRVSRLAPTSLVTFLDHHDDFNASPYESFAVFGRETIDTAGRIKDESPIILSSLDEYFERMASYSNNNFFSEDTIFSPEYRLPKIIRTKTEVLSDGRPTTFGIAEDVADEYRLVYIPRQLIWRRATKDSDKPSIQDVDNKIVRDYWSRLSKQAVLHGAGVVKLFFDEVEKERKTKVLYEKNRSWLGKRVDGFKQGMFGVASALYGSSVAVEDLDTGVDESELRAQVRPEARNKTDQKAGIAEASPPAGGEASKTASVQRPVTTKPVKITLAATSTPILPSPPPKPPASSNVSSELPLPGVGGPNPPPSPSPASPSSSSDTAPPDISISINECSASLATGGCLIATTTITVVWSSTANDLSRYSVTCESNGSSCSNFNFASTTATTTTYTVQNDNATYIFKAKAIDTSGNESSEQTATTEIATRPIAINEIAWAGTSASRAQDEWIELYNPTGKSISLANWVLRSATDNSPYIQLSGTIASKGYFLLERTDDNTISDTSANQTYTGALNNTGEELQLSRASTTIDQTPAVSACGGWCYRDNSSYKTMERYDYASSGADTNNWGTFAGFLANGKNADNENISGTPTRRNSINYYLSNTTLTADTTIKKSRSPYIVTSGFTVPSGITLTIEPGVVIKFYNTSSSLAVNGALLAGGTSADKIIFTSFNDDDCGISGGCGDTNATTTATAAGDWASIKISSGAASSTLSYVSIRYGGVEDAQTNHWTNLRIENASTTVKNSTIEKSKTYGVWIKNATGGGSGITIESNTIRENNRNISGQTKGIGLLLTASSPAITGNTITQNTKGLVMESSSAPSVTGNNFTNQTDAAVEVTNSYPAFSNNSASSNGTNGVLIQNSFSQNHTLSADLPYVFTGQSTVQSGVTLTVPASTIVKFSGTSSWLKVEGRLATNGTASGKVIFTSINDDDCGISGGCGDTNATTTAAAAGDWLNLTFANNNATSTLTYATIRYGGDKSAMNADDGAVRIKNASVEIRNSTIEFNHAIGVWMQNSTSTVIADSLIQEHRDSTNETFYGIFATASSTPTLLNTHFKLNEQHIFTDGTSTTTDAGGNIFE